MSPKEALCRALATRIKNLKSGTSRSYSTHRDKNLSKMNRRFEDGTTGPESTFANQQGASVQLSEVISKLSQRINDFTSRIEELTIKLTSNKAFPSSQKIALQIEACNGSVPTSYFKSGLGDGSPTGCVLPNPLTSSQLPKGSSLTQELSSIM